MQQNEPVSLKPRDEDDASNAAFAQNAKDAKERKKIPFNNTECKVSFYIFSQENSFRKLCWSIISR